MKPLLDLTDVNYTYQTAEGETPAVKNLSFRVFPDHFLDDPSLFITDIWVTGQFFS